MMTALPDLLRSLESQCDDDPTDLYPHLISEYHALDPEKDYMLAALVLRGICLTLARCGSSHIKTVGDFTFLIENKIGGEWHKLSNEEISRKLRDAVLFLAAHAQEPLAPDCYEGTETCFRCRMYDKQTCKHYISSDSKEGDIPMKVVEVPEVPFKPKTLNVTIGVDRKREALLRQRERINALLEKERSLLEQIERLSKRRFLGLGAYAEVAVLGLFLNRRQSKLDLFRTEAKFARDYLSELVIARSPEFTNPLETVNGKAAEMTRALSWVQLTRQDMKMAFEDLALVKLDPSTFHCPDAEFLRPSILQQWSEMARGKTAQELFDAKSSILSLEGNRMVDIEDGLTRAVLLAFLFNRWLNIQNMKCSFLKWTRPDQKLSEEDDSCCHLIPFYDSELIGIQMPNCKLIDVRVDRLLLAYLVLRLSSGVKTDSRAIHSLMRGLV